MRRLIASPPLRLHRRFALLECAAVSTRPTRLRTTILLQLSSCRWVALLSRARSLGEGSGCANHAAFDPRSKHKTHPHQTHVRHTTPSLRLSLLLHRTMLARLSKIVTRSALKKSLSERRPKLHFTQRETGRTKQRLKTAGQSAGPRETTELKNRPVSCNRQPVNCQLLEL